MTNNKFHFLNDLRDEVHANAANKGFHEETHEIGTSLMLITSELAKALESDRRNYYAQMGEYSRYITASKNPRTCFELFVKDSVEDELADALIRILDTCGLYDIDIARHVEMKMAYNVGRERLHGKKY